MNKKIQVWGDSILKGIIYDDKAQKYVILKENALIKAQEAAALSIENFSRFGQTITKAQPKLIKHLDDADLPDIILLELGGNDCDFNWQEVGDAPECDHQPQTPLNTYREILTDMIGKIINKGIKPVLASLPPLDYQRYFNWITKGNVSKEGVLKWLKSPYTIYTWHESYDRCAKEVARQFDIPVIDVRESFLNQNDYSAFMCEDGIHPNQRGQILIAETIIRFFNQRLLS